MKILMIGSHSDVKGGITSVISQILSFDWSKQGICMKYIPTFTDRGNVRKVCFFIWAYICIFLNFIFFKPDICHMHMSYKGSFHRKYLVQKLCILFKVKNIIHLHGSEFEKFYLNSNHRTQNKIKLLLRDCHKLIVLGTQWENTIKKIEPNTDIIVLNNAIEITSDKVSHSNQEFNILFLGVLIERKGVHDLLKAFEILNQDNILKDFNIKLLIAGDGPEKNKLINSCQQWGISNYVNFIGWVDNKGKKELLKKGHLFVLPSYNEGLPIAILEAMNYGLPIISTRVGSINEAVINEQNGFLINPGDIITLAKYISELAEDCEKWRIFSEASKKICIDKFDEKNMFMELSELYSGCVNEI